MKTCIDCGKVIGEKSKRCAYHSRAMIGVRNKGAKRSPETLERMRLSHLGKKPWNTGKKGVYRKDYLEYMSKITKERYSNPANHPNWKGGSSFEPYAIGWNEKLKESIRTRDGHKCRECGVPQQECTERLCVHHIDFNKSNLSTKNLISLCRRCHHKTHNKISDQEMWIKYYSNKQYSA